MNRYIKHATLLGAAASLLLFSGCGSSDSKKSTSNHSYEVTVTNLTAGQPLSPVGVILHSGGYHPFTIGQAAGTGLEHLAEGGDVTTLLEEADATTGVTATEAGSGIILPGAHETVTLQSLGETQLSVVSMLVNTNDAFIALDASDIAGMAVNESKSFLLNTYDAGSESNSETAATVPGPAGNGEGYNAVRDDNDIVTLHPGVITSDDGLSASALTSIHKWDNPTATVTIVRIQ